TPSFTPIPHLSPWIPLSRRRSTARVGVSVLNPSGAGPGLGGVHHGLSTGGNGEVCAGGGGGIGRGGGGGGGRRAGGGAGAAGDRRLLLAGRRGRAMDGVKRGDWVVEPRVPAARDR